MSSAYATAAATQAKKDRHVVSWTQEEDNQLREQVAVHGSDNWTIIAANFKDKTGRQCRRRWLTYLNTECKKGGWSQEEDMLLCEAQKIFGNRWTEIAKVVSGRTDNAVKNRFSTLCKKRAKHHTISKENNDSCIHPSNKKIMVEPSAKKQQTGCGGSDNAEDFCSYERLAATHGISGGRSRPPLAVLTQNLNNLRCLSVQCHLDSSKPTACDTNANFEVQGNFLRRDDPKLTALLQHAELLSSLAVKAYSENKNQSLDDSWKVAMKGKVIRALLLLLNLFAKVEPSLLRLSSHKVVKTFLSHRFQNLTLLLKPSHLFIHSLRRFLVQNFHQVRENFC